MFEFVLPAWITLALAGALGQLLRALVGVKKAIDSGEQIDTERLVWTTLYGMFWGGIIGYFCQDWKAAFTSGFAVTDFTEGLVKVLQHKAVNNKKK